MKPGAQGRGRQLQDVLSETMRTCELELSIRKADLHRKLTRYDEACSSRDHFRFEAAFFNSVTMA